MPVGKQCVEKTERAELPDDCDSDRLDDRGVFPLRAEYEHDSPGSDVPVEVSVRVPDLQTRHPAVRDFGVEAGGTIYRAEQGTLPAGDLQGVFLYHS